jgi:polyhydroxyalkanoate synthesis regulator phasin
MLTPDQRRVLSSVDSIGADFFKVWNEVWTANSGDVQIAFAQTIHHIRDVLNNMEELLNEMVKHTDISKNAGRETLLEIIKIHEKDKTFTISRFSKRFMFAKSDSKRRKLIKRMGEDIELLKELNEGQEKMNKFIAKGKEIEFQGSHGRFLDRVRGYCDNLYHALSNRRCECHESSSAMLRLEKRETPETKEGNELRFSVILIFEHTTARALQETEIRVEYK